LQTGTSGDPTPSLADIEVAKELLFVVLMTLLLERTDMLASKPLKLM